MEYFITIKTDKHEDNLWTRVDFIQFLKQDTKLHRDHKLL